MYTKRQKEIARVIRENLVGIAIMMFCVFLGSMCFAMGLKHTPDLNTRVLMIVCQLLLIVLNGLLAFMIYWARKVLTSGQGKL